jgi:hypothetical protein
MVPEEEMEVSRESSESKRELFFVKNSAESYLDIFRLVSRGRETVLLHPFNRMALDFYQSVSSLFENISFFVLRNEIEEPLPSPVKIVEDGTVCDFSLLFHTDAEYLSTVLYEYIDTPSKTIIAPITEHYYKNRPLYIITIPKSGTHLLFEFLGMCGLSQGVASPREAVPGTYNHILGNDTHTPCEPFLTSVSWNSPEGRYHPFFRSPALFLYRHPLDILVSESEYLTNYKKTNRAYYFNELHPSKLVSELMNSVVNGSIQNRVLIFSAWLHFPNVIPVSYEELVGPEGGGAREEQIASIWSLQLKLHIPGDPDVYARGIYNRNSPTFHTGKIGRYREVFKAEHYHELESLFDRGRDFIREFGYRKDMSAPFFSELVNGFRHKPLKIIPPPEYQPDIPPCRGNVFRKIPVEPMQAKNHTIITVHDRFYALPPFIGEFNPNGHDLDTFEGVISGGTLEEVLDRIPEQSLNVPILVESWKGYNIVAYLKNYYAIPQSIGPFDLMSQLSEIEDRIIVVSSLAEARVKIDMYESRLLEPET